MTDQSKDDAKERRARAKPCDGCDPSFGCFGDPYRDCCKDVTPATDKDDATIEEAKRELERLWSHSPQARAISGLIDIATRRGEERDAARRDATIDCGGTGACKTPEEPCWEHLGQALRRERDALAEEKRQAEEHADTMAIAAEAAESAAHRSEANLERAEALLLETRAYPPSRGMTLLPPGWAERRDALLRGRGRL